MVDPSLLRQAADRGVTICFADLDGADGLWVPEERTVLVNRGLSDAAVAQVIEHELAHVAIDDQHADLDAGREVIVGHPPARRSGGPWSMVLAAAGFVAVVGGVVFGLVKVGVPGGEQVVGPVPSGLTASEGGGGAPQPTVVVTRDAQGRVITVTIAVSSSPALPTESAAGSFSPTPSPTLTAARTSAKPVPGAPSATVSSEPALSATPEEPTPSPTPEPTTAEPTTPPPTADPGEGEGGGIGDGDGAGDAAGTDGVATRDATEAALSTGAGLPGATG